MIYKIPLSWVDTIEPYLYGCLFKWLGVSKIMSNVSLYCDETPCPLPIHALVTEFEKQDWRNATPVVRGRISQFDNIPGLCTGEKWKVEVSSIDSRIKMSKVMGNTQVVRTGLGCIKRWKRSIKMRHSRTDDNFWK